MTCVTCDIGAVVIGHERRSHTRSHENRTQEGANTSSTHTNICLSGQDTHARGPLPLVGIDLLNWDQQWPWPLPFRCHGSNAVEEMSELHAMHLYGKVAVDADYWHK